MRARRDSPERRATEQAMITAVEVGDLLPNTHEVAKELDLSPRMIRLLHKKLGVGHKVWGRLVFTAADRKKMAGRSTKPGPKRGRDGKTEGGKDGGRRHS